MALYPWMEEGPQLLPEKRLGGQRLACQWTGLLGIKLEPCLRTATRRLDEAKPLRCITQGPPSRITRRMYILRTSVKGLDRYPIYRRSSMVEDGWIVAAPGGSLVFGVGCCF